MIYLTETMEHRKTNSKRVFKYKTVADKWQTDEDTVSLDVPTSHLIVKTVDRSNVTIEILYQEFRRFVSCGYTRRIVILLQKFKCHELRSLRGSVLYYIQAGFIAHTSSCITTRILLLTRKYITYKNTW